MSTYTGIEDVQGEERMDSRDLIELQDTLRDTPLSQFQDGDFRVLCAINELEDAGIEDWPYGAAFIREDAFEDYARELADDIGAINDAAAWPHSCIDWTRATRELSMDYTSVDFLGHSYYVR